MDAALVHNYCSLHDTRLLDLLPLARENGIGLINASPFGSGLLTDRGPADWNPANLEQRALQFSSQNPDIPTTMLEPHGLTYDLLLKPPHIRPATQLVDRFPLQKFVVDHIAKPDILGGELYEFAYYEYCGSDHAADMARLG